MKPLLLLAGTLALITTSRADMSYRVTRKITGGALAGVTGNMEQDSRFYLRGQKIAVVNVVSTQIFDFDAQTTTNFYQLGRTYDVKKFSDLNSGNPGMNIPAKEAKIDAQTTGRTKVINRANAHELMISIETADTGSREGQMKVEIAMWLSADVPGSRELRDFYRSHTGGFPWAAVGRIDTAVPMVLPPALAAYVGCFDNGFRCRNAATRTAADQLQSRILSMEGVPVQQVMRVTAPVDSFWIAFLHGAPAAPGPSIEVTMNSVDFSTNPVPDSVFAIPDGYTEGRAVSLGGIIGGLPSVAPPPPGGSATRVGSGVSGPVLIADSRVDPQRTEAAKAANVTGTVLLSVVVGTEGSPREIRVVRGLGMGLDERAIEAVEKWKFRPGMRSGTPIETRIQVDVRFTP